MISPRRTITRRSLGTSMPTVVLPGIGATIRTLGTARAIARSSARLMIFLTLRPASSSISNWVITGPVSICDDPHLVAEVEQRALQQQRPRVDLGLVLLDGERRRRLEQVVRRELEPPLVRRDDGQPRTRRGGRPRDGPRVGPGPPIGGRAFREREPGQGRVRVDRGQRLGCRLDELVCAGPHQRRLRGYGRRRLIRRRDPAAAEAARDLLEGPGDERVVAERQADQPRRQQDQEHAGPPELALQERHAHRAEVAAPADGGDRPQPPAELLRAAPPPRPAPSRSRAGASPDRAPRGGGTTARPRRPGRSARAATTTPAPGTGACASAAPTGPHGLDGDE